MSERLKTGDEMKQRLPLSGLEEIRIAQQRAYNSTAIVQA